MEVPAGQFGVQGLSASAILAVAEGLRWTDPQLSVALAEHVARAAGADVGARTAAERSAVLALGQSDRAAELIVRALPHLREAELEGRIVDAGTLRCELSLAALRCGDTDAAERLLEPLAAGRVLPPAVRADALVAWAAARASAGDVAGVDAAARQIDDLVGETADDARRLATRRARAEARRHAGDTAGALEILRPAVSEAYATDGGRQAALLLADRVELLAGLGRRDEAREAGTPALAETPRATTSLALGRLRCVLAQHVHLPAGEFETAERLAREAEADLVARGHEAQVAVAVEVLAAVAEGRGDVRQALDELRRARPHVITAHEETTRARTALAAALARDDDRIPSGPRPATTPTEDVDGGWASTASSDRGGADVSPPASPEPTATSALDSPPVAPESEPAPESDATPDRDATTPEPDPEPAPAPRRRRNRYREDTDPGDLLAAALAAARGEFAAFSTAPAGADLAAVDAGPGTASASGDRTDDPVHDHPADEDPVDEDPADDPTAARRRRLARARARWEAPESLLPRRDDATWSSRPEERDDPLGPDDDGPGESRRHGEGRAARRRADEDESDHGPGARENGRSTASSLRGDALGPGPAARDTTDEDRGRPAARRRDALDDPEPATLAARLGVPPVDANGRGAREQATTSQATTGQATTGQATTSQATTGPDGNGVSAAGPGVNGLGASGPGANGPGVNGPGVNGPGVNGRGAGPGGADDDLARELALTLVDLLSEYEDAGVPLGNSPVTTTVAPTPAPTTTTSTRANGHAPSGAPGPQTTSTRTTAASATSSTPSPARTAGARSTRNGAPSARRADDSGPRLADLLADAMDAYHSAGPGPDAADDRRARR